MLLKHKKKVAKQSSKKKTNSSHNNSKKITNPKKKTRNTLRGKKYNKIKGGGLTFRENITLREISALMIDDNTNEELGYFTLSTTRPYDLSVNIDDNYQGKGLSKELLKLFYHVITRRYIRTDESGNNLYVFDNGITLNDSDILAIDTDTSGNSRGKSFWDYIGMTPNRHYDRQNPNYESRGYEKTITLKDLLNRIYHL